MVEVLRRYSRPTYGEKSFAALVRILESPPARRAQNRQTPRIHHVEMRLGTAAVFQLVTDYESGLSIAELQDRFGLSKSSVSRLLREFGAEVRRHPLAEDVMTRIVERYQAGLTIREIGAELGLPKTTVRDALTRAGVAMRPAARRRQRPADS